MKNEQTVLLDYLRNCIQAMTNTVNHFNSYAETDDLIPPPDALDSIDALEKLIQQSPELLKQPENG